LGFCGAPYQNDGVEVSRILKVNDWVEHIKNLGANAIYFSPVFESDAHGYDTRDYLKIDCRLGSNDDFKLVCENLHKNNIKVVLDGVFNHVGRGFWAFLDVKEKKWESQYKDWFIINFDGNSAYNDGFWYEGWEGHYELVKLNLKNPQVVDYLIDCVKKWIEWFQIDGLRLDVAYCLDENFLRRLKFECKQLKSDFFILGEMLHGDYNRLVNDEMLDSCTNYECYKGLYSSFNSLNMYEISYSLNRQFGAENWTLYKGKHLMCFADNHDVERLASVLTDENHLKPLYGLLFTMPGIPCVYYGSEWGAKGKKSDGDNALRVSFEAPQSNELTEFISKLSTIHKCSKALCCGDYKQLLITNKQYVFERCADDERVIIAINADSENFTAHFNANAGCGVDLITGEHHDFGAGSELQPYSISIWKV
ncbi:MAG: maltodextrin glucosidase, partial [Clostridia bacterium]|nr:maltodextrin glucosidase [Clostridia bacterium]